MNKIMWCNYFKSLIIIVLIIINATLQVNGDEYVSKFNNMNMSSDPDYKTFSGPQDMNQAPLLVDPDHVIIQNSTSSIDTRNLLALYESAKENYLSDLNDDRTEILKQIQTIDEIFDSFSNEIQGVVHWSEPAASQSKCSISKQNFENLQKDIQAILSRASESSPDNNKCKLNFDSTDNCNGVMKTIQCGLDYVKSGFLNVLVNGASVSEVSKWKNALDELSKKFAQVKEDLKQSLSQYYQVEIDRIQTILQNLGKLLKNALERLEKNTAELCVEEIVLGMITEAVDHFNDLQSTPISVIVKNAYGFTQHSSPNDVERADYISQFIDRLGRADAMDTFYKEMKARNHLNSVRVLFLSYIIQNSNTLLANAAMTEIRDYEERIIATFMDVFSFNKQNTEFDQFLLFNSGKYFNYYQLRIVVYSLTRLRDQSATHSYKQTQIKNMLDSIRKFPYFDQAITGLSYVADFMIANKFLESQNTLRLIYYTNYFKHKLLKTSNLKLIGLMLSRFYNILRKFPENVVNFVVNPNACRIKGGINSGYLYADGQSKADEDRRHVYFWKSNVPPKDLLDLESKWEFQTSNNCEHFTIKNVQYGEYMYAASLKAEVGLPERTVYTWVPKESAGPEGNWEIIPRQASSRYHFTLRNFHTDEYFHLGPFITGDKRRVFTWKNGVPTGLMWQESLWDIEC